MKCWLPMVMCLAIVPSIAEAQTAPPWMNPTTLAHDPNSTRLFFAPTGRALKRGEAYVGVYEALLPSLQIGITDRLSLGGGAFPLPFGELSQPFWITPKLQILNTAKTSASIGTISIFNDGSNGSDGVAYGVVTHGDADGAVTIGGGYTYHRAPDHTGRSPLIMIGGDHSVRSGLKLITENYKFAGGGVLGGGLRYYSDKWSADFGMMVAIVKSPDSPLHASGGPVINIARRF